MLFDAGSPSSSPHGWIAQNLLPDPLVVEQRLFDVPEYVRKYLAERGVGNIELISSDEALRKQLFEESTSLLREAATSGERGQKAIHRLGSKGQLPVGHYQVEFGKAWTDEFSTFERLTNILDIFRNPDFVEHLPLPSLSSEQGADTSSTWLVKYIESGKKRPFYMIVDAQRAGARLAFGAAWRLYPHLVSVEGVSTPQEMLARFLGRYGVPTSINDGPFELVHSQLRAPMTAVTGGMTGEFSLNYPPGFKSTVFTAASIGQDDVNREMVIAYMYCVNMALYSAELRALRN